MRTIQVLGIVAALAMLAVIVWAGAQASLGEDFAQVIDRPWGVVSLVDLYIGLALAAAWVVYRELPGPAVAWIIGLITLGNLALGIYVAWAATQAIRSSDVGVFFSGTRA